MVPVAHPIDAVTREELLAQLPGNLRHLAGATVALLERVSGTVRYQPDKRWREALRARLKLLIAAGAVTAERGGGNGEFTYRRGL